MQRLHITAQNLNGKALYKKINKLFAFKFQNILSTGHGVKRFQATSNERPDITLPPAKQQNVGAILPSCLQVYSITVQL